MVCVGCMGLCAQDVPSASPSLVLSYPSPPQHSEKCLFSLAITHVPFEISVSETAKKGVKNTKMGRKRCLYGFIPSHLAKQLSVFPQTHVFIHIHVLTRPSSVCQWSWCGGMPSRLTSCPQGSQISSISEKPLVTRELCHLFWGRTFPTAPMYPPCSIQPASFPYSREEMEQETHYKFITFPVPFWSFRS